MHLSCNMCPARTRPIGSDCQWLVTGTWVAPLGCKLPTYVGSSAVGSLLPVGLSVAGHAYATCGRFMQGMPCFAGTTWSISGCGDVDALRAPDAQCAAAAHVSCTSRPSALKAGLVVATNSTHAEIRRGWEFFLCVNPLRQLQVAYSVEPPAASLAASSSLRNCSASQLLQCLEQCRSCKPRGSTSGLMPCE
jgi:hypothetical protein